MKRAAYQPCTYCNGSGFQKTKHGVVLCLVCSPGGTRQVEREAADWFGYVLFSTLIVLIAFVAAPWAHFLASH